MAGFRGGISVAAVAAALFWSQAALAQINNVDPQTPVPPGAATGAQAEAETTSDVVVTGSLIRGTAKDTALPVDVVDQRALERRGQPTVLDVIRNLPSSGAVIGETNLINAAGAGYNGSSTANLRGLGANRTLVLLNGKRLASYLTGVVDTNLIPLAAIGRVEVLKDGAAATYGSDAIAGVVNFITRENFNGLELEADHRVIRSSDGDSDFGAVAGFTRERTNILVSFGLQRRSRISNRDRDFVNRGYYTNPQGGWSGNANPGAFRRVNAAGTNIGGPAIDPQCEVLGDVAVSPSSCLYTYTPFDDLVEPHTRYQVFASANHDVSDAFKLHFEAFYAHTKAVSDQSPSYTPTQYPTGAILNPAVPAVPNRYIIPCGNPGLQDMFTKNPAFAAAIGGAGCINATNAPAGSYTAVAGWRLVGVSGSPFTGYSRYTDRVVEAFRVSGGAGGDLGFANYDITGTWSGNVADTHGGDALVNRVQLALEGLGGFGCTGNTPGANGCVWLNPFSNAYQRNVATGQVNPQYNPAVANSSDLFQWLEAPLTSHARNTILVLDGLLNGRIKSFSLPGGNIGWAVGGQYRRITYRSDYGYYENLNSVPCTDSLNVPGATCGTLTGPFNSITGYKPVNLAIRVKAAFGELNLPVFRTLNVQAAVRYEDYGGGTGSTTNPKVAAKWQVFPALALRGSYGTTFRGPTPSNLDPSATTTLSALTAAGGTSKNIDFYGSPGIKPEKATNTNVGAILKVHRFSASVDYYRFIFKDAIVAPSYDAIATSVVPTANGPANCSAPLRNLILFDTGNQCVTGVTTGANILRVRADLINGPRTKTSGLDFDVSYGFPLLSGDLSLTGNATYVLDYDVGSTTINGVLLTPGYSAAGYLNDDRGGNSLPRFKAYGRVDYTLGRHNFGVGVRYISDYDDNRTAIFTAASPLGKHISATALVDLNYVLRIKPVTLSFAISNLLDRDPSFARTAYSYDTFTGDPLGRTFKFGIKAGF